MRLKYLINKKIIIKLNILQILLFLLLLILFIFLYRSTNEKIFQSRASSDILKKVKPLIFKYNGLAGTPTDREYLGVIAQDLEKIAPYLVSERNMKLRPSDSETRPVKVVDYNGLSLLLFDALKEQGQIIDALEKKIIEVEKNIGCPKN